MRSQRLVPVLVLLGALAGLGLLCSRVRRAPDAAPRAPDAAPPERPRSVEPAAPQPKLALLVGIDRLAPGSQLRQLEGCKNDVRAARALLVERFGFAPEATRVLLDAEATHEAIVRAWREWFVPRCGPETEAVFWFAGHGSQAPDASGREPDGLDQTLIAWDSRAAGRDGEYDLSDDELYVLVREVTRRGAHLLAVTDACHSATDLRGVPQELAPRVRGAEAGSRVLDRGRIAPFWDGLDWIDDDDARRAADPLVLHLSACARGQNAYERSVLDARGAIQSFGVLSYHLAAALREARPEQSAAELCERAAAAVRASSTRQDPCVDGPGARPLFGGRFAPGGRGFRARWDGERLCVEGGSLCGLLPRSELVVEGADGERLAGTATLESCAALESRARWSAPAGTSSDARLFARELRRACGTRRLELALGVPGWLEACTPAERAELELRAALGPPRAGAELVLLREEAGGLALRDTQGALLWRELAARRGGARDDLASLIARELDLELQYRALLALPEGGPLQLEARFRASRKEDDRDLLSDLQSRTLLRPALEPSPGCAGRVYRTSAGADEQHAWLVTLELSNPFAEALWVSVLSVCEDRRIRPVTPDEKPFRLEPGQREAVEIQLEHPAALDLDRPLLDRYLVLASRKRFDLGALTRATVQRSDREHPVLPELLATGMRSEVLRSAVRAPADVAAEDWGLTLLDLLVERTEP